MKNILIVIGIFAVLALLAAYLLGVFRPAASPAFTPPFSSSPSSTPVASNSPSPTIKPPASSPVFQSATPSPGNVDFTFVVNPGARNGFSQTFSSDITNTGNGDAHNVWVKVEASSGGSRVQINGQDYLRVDIGTIKAGEKITKQTTIEFNIVDGLKIMQSGAQFTLTIYSDEKTQTFGYDYKP